MKKVTKKITTFDEHLDKQYGKKGTMKEKNLNLIQLRLDWEKCLKKNAKKLI